MNQHIIDEYRAQYAIWRTGKRLHIGFNSSRNDERAYLNRLCEQIGYVIFEQGRGTYKVLNLPNRILDVKRKVAAMKPAKSDREHFAKLYRDQTRTYATPAERKAILQGLTDSGDMWVEENEPEVSKVPYYDIPVFMELLAA